MRQVTFLPAAALASAMIGPVVALGGIGVSTVTGVDNWATLWVAPVAVVFAIPVGFVVSILPNLMGAALLGWLGRGNIAARLPVMWALAGAGVGCALVLGLARGVPEAEPLGLIGAIGAISALLCRWKTVWPRTNQTGRSVMKKLSSELSRRVSWRDLVAMRPIDGWIECLHPMPWLAASLLLASQGWWPLALPCSFMFFLTALRLNHEAIHGHLGFRNAGNRWVMHGLSALMLGSNNAVAFNHLQHHRHLNTAADIEGKAGRMSGWRVLLYGPMFPIEMHIDAWRRGGRALRRRMLIDAAGNVVVIGTAVALASTVLIYHLAVMALAQSLTAFFAVWITHHDTAEDGLGARTQRSRLINFVTYNMFFHLEHHLFPAVPVKRLDRLAARMDAVVPEIAARAGRVV